jgi:hypothetical protein
LIKAKTHGEYPRFIIINKGGVVSGEDRMTQGNTTEESGIGKAAKNTQTFDAKK